MKNLFIVLLFLTSSQIFAQDKYDPFKMEFVTQDILTSFVNGTADHLKKHISHKWLEDNSVDINEKFVNNYAPQYYDILFMKDNLVIVKIGSDALGWAHLLMFEFRIEDGVYRVVPKGVSDAHESYIDPWIEVASMICSDTNDED